MNSDKIFDYTIDQISSQATMRGIGDKCKHSYRQQNGLFFSLKESVTAASLPAEAVVEVDA